MSRCLKALSIDRGALGDRGIVGLLSAVDEVLPEESQVSDEWAILEVFNPRPENPKPFRPEKNAVEFAKVVYRQLYGRDVSPEQLANRFIRDE
ncbi:hypothetical protein MAPG_08603 [Magnaporthiopsis poae ATCC 64411]|uniref:Uncharacterized protein n=1 Tax=Magnaporthiopsis poae (strain ATCC 64411 / 73-15) TaxID=644358 RepID=A0A0C4E7T1_MAGP6|nr:hypothetical protein MAPG_08603 [Magnaporthiopsis poae ATCC 64411]